MTTAANLTPATTPAMAKVSLHIQTFLFVRGLFIDRHLRAVCHGFGNANRIGRALGLND
jgi:hypothetical protein